jgi:hypothetical protein
MMLIRVGVGWWRIDRIAVFSRRDHSASDAACPGGESTLQCQQGVSIGRREKTQKSQKGIALSTPLLRILRFFRGHLAMRQVRRQLTPNVLALCAAGMVQFGLDVIQGGSRCLS